MIKNILHFLSELKQNNNREWFAENKDWYNQVKTDFEALGANLIREISTFDEDIKHVDVKDCVFRIYRDVRFSHDKSPYKTHIGIYIASHGGRKSQRGGYYIHFEPDNCFVGCGVWMPQPNILKALRQSIYENIDEFNDILENSAFKKQFPKLNEEGKMKKIPLGFPADFPQAELLKNKSFLVDTAITDEHLVATDFAKTISQLLKVAYPFMSFLNYTVDEVLGIK